jgi:predicted DNA-binding transcriptional regulator YafY
MVASGTPRSRGDKRSSWATFRRRLVLVRRLLRSPATVADLIRAAEAEQGAEAYPPAAALAVKHDLQSLRDEFGCVISYQRTQRIYVLEELGDLALLDLPDDGLEALAFLDATFPDDAPIGGSDRVRLLIGRMFALLPAARRDAIGRHFVLPRVAWSASYTEDVNPKTLEIVQQAISLRRQLTFEYCSNYDTDKRSRQYQVAPYLVYFRDGHTYLDSTVLQPPPDRDKLLFRAIQFRLDRIVPGKSRMAHESIPDERPSQLVYEVVYVLAPAVARNRDVAHWFPETIVVYQDDGSALVKGRATNLWQARQILMRYIEHCQVLEPPELVEMIRQTVARMAALYTVPI